jgi:hypothetical protein
MPTRQSQGNGDEKKEKRMNTDQKNLIPITQTLRIMRIQIASRGKKLTCRVSGILPGYPYEE